jgi:hypothetical protein
MKIDKAKVKKNTKNALGVAIGLGLGVFATNLLRGKLPSVWLEPLVSFVPGMAGTILLQDDFQNSIAQGVTAAGVIDGGGKIISAVVTKVPSLAPIKKITPQVTNMAGLGRLGNMDNMRDRALLGAYNGGSQVPDGMMIQMI